VGKKENADGVGMGCLLRTMAGGFCRKRQKKEKGVQKLPDGEKKIKYTLVQGTQKMGGGGKTGRKGTMFGTRTRGELFGDSHKCVGTRREPVMAIQKGFKTRWLGVGQKKKKHPNPRAKKLKRGRRPEIGVIGPKVCVRLK